MSPIDAEKHGRPSEPGEYDEGMQALLQIIWGDGYLSPGGAAEVARLLEGSDIGGCAILDIGCGLGAIDELLVKEYHAASVIGIDVDPTLLERMRARIERARMTGCIQGLQVAGGPLPFADGSFDVVFSKDSLVQIPDKPAIFAEVLRVLRPEDGSSPAIGCAEARHSIRRKCWSSSASRASPTTWRLWSRAPRDCARLDSTKLKFATGMAGISSWHGANFKPWRVLFTR